MQLTRDDIAAIQCSLKDCRVYIVQPPWVRRDAGQGHAPWLRNTWSRLSEDTRKALSGIDEARERLMAALAAELKREGASNAA